MVKNGYVYLNVFIFVSLCLVVLLLAVFHMGIHFWSHAEVWHVVYYGSVL